MELQNDDNLVADYVLLRRVAVKFLDDLKREDQFQLPYEDGAESSFPKDLKEFWDPLAEKYPGITLKRVYTAVSPERIQQLVKEAEERNRTYKAPNFLTFFAVDTQSLDEAERIAKDLSGWKGVVEYAYVQPLASLPTLNHSQEYIDEPTSFSSATNPGVNALNVPGWTAPGSSPWASGGGIQFVDIEKGWDLGHPLLQAAGAPPKISFPSFPPGTPNNINLSLDSSDPTKPPFANGQHGTSVLGILAANEITGTPSTPPNWKGIGERAKGFVISIYWNPAPSTLIQGIEDAIVAATDLLDAGDVILLELEIDVKGFGSSDDPPKLWPVECSASLFDPIQLATVKGITVVEAAGNSNQYFDDVNNSPFKVDPASDPIKYDPNPNYNKDSGAIIVGAVSLVTYGPNVRGNKSSTSNYGSRVNCFAWGNSVFTAEIDPSTGANTDGGNPKTRPDFHGTSSASAIIAGVALVVQGIAKANGFGDNPNGTYTPSGLRAILSTYGTPSNDPSTDLIGIMPDLQDINNIIKKISTPTCIPRPQTTSGAFSGPPDWLGSSWPQQQDKLDDPRWTGALHQGFPVVGGTSEQALFRALYDTVGSDNFLYLSWWVKEDGSLDTDEKTGDHFFVGFQPSPGSTAMVIKVVPFKQSSSGSLSSFTNQPAEGTGGVGSITTFTKTGVTDWLMVANPAWINQNTRIWLDTVNKRYAVQMRVPLQPGSITNPAGPNLGTDFRMWYSMRVELPAGPVFYSWPDRQEPYLTTDGTGGALIEKFPPPEIWGWYRLGTTGCASGVSLSYDDIGTTNNPTSRIVLDTSNHLFALPKNASGHVIPHDTIRARFRIANWGSMICDPDAPWDNIPGGTDVTHTADYPTGTSTAPGQARPSDSSAISFDWTPDSATYGSKNPDQCMIVNLTGAGVTFTQDSACRNMMFDTASVSEHIADIDIRGLASISSQPRDVYILVEKINMPTNTTDGYTEGKYLSTTMNRIIAADNIEDSNSLENRLRNAQKLLDKATPESTSKARLVELMAELRLQLAYFKAKDEARNKELTEQLISLIDSWLSAVKQDAAARKRLTVLLRSWVRWLRASAAGGAIVETVALIKDLTEWLSAINSDPTSSKYLPKIGEALQQWLANLVDDGSITKLSEVIDWFMSWLNSDRSSAMLLAKSEVLRDWLASRGRDENMARQKLVWVIQDIIDWLPPATDRLISLMGALNAAGVTAADMEKIFPTCRFHVYHDTGRKEARTGGRSVPILEAQVPFGYWLYHEDDLKGWTAILEGATRLAENFYVVKVPNNGSTEITTKIQAVEQDEERIPEPPIVSLPPDGNTGCCIAIVAWLDSKGSVGKILASVVHFFCRLLGQSTT